MGLGLEPLPEARASVFVVGQRRIELVLLIVLFERRADGVGVQYPNEGRTMSEAQIGLLTATPLIMLFASALRAMGVLSTTATVSAIALSVAIAAVLFSTQ